MQFQRLAFIITFTMAWVALQPCSAVELRTALVVGNSAYPFGPLANAANDASDIARTLRSVGFEVTLKTDVDQQGIEEAIDSFGAVLKNRGGVGLFYFAGHGVQINDANYLIPIGQGVSERDLKYKAVNADRVMDELKAAENGLNIVILDACRNNPFAARTRGGRLGLAQMDGTSGTFISFSTSPGAVAFDGNKRNSPYTKHLMAAIETPDLTLEETFKRTLKGVHQETQKQQIPWISSTFFGDFIFHPTRAANPSPEVPALTGVYRATGTNPDGSRYRGITLLTPSANGYEFQWWIGQQVFVGGTGHFAGRMLVVDWGSQSPVIYMITADRLEGEWADGKATETLEIFARAASDSLPPPAGRYRVRGRDRSGNDYSGTASIANVGNRYRIQWSIGSRRYQGVGVLQNNVLTVNFGGMTPAVYALADDGRLSGLWDGSYGEETLTPDQ